MLSTRHATVHAPSASARTPMSTAGTPKGTGSARGRARVKPLGRIDSSLRAPVSDRAARPVLWRGDDRETTAGDW